MEKGTKALMTAQPRFHKQFKAVQKRPPDLKKTRQEKHLTAFQQFKKKGNKQKINVRQLWNFINNSNIV